MLPRHFLVLRAVVVAFSLMEICSSAEAPHQRKTAVGSGGYPLEVHQLFRAQLAKKQPKPNGGVWSPWSPWSPCSRSCGGGVTQQTRHCVTRPADSRFDRGQRRRRQDKWHRQQGNACIGLYRRIHVCNTQVCPGGRDARTEQCAAFNHRPFKGKLHLWEPYLQAGDECALNCRAVGMDFYATLNRTVADGTSCGRPHTSQGRRAPEGTIGVCIGGRCKSVGANGVVGSLDVQAPIPEECSACIKGTCRSYNGLYTRSDLPAGYSVVTQIPQGACRIAVQQLKHTKNVIALRDSDGSFILNGDWKFGSSRTVDGAGTKFSYLKQDTSSFETVTAPGPLTSPVDIMIVYFQPNQGIKYSFSLPIDHQLPPPPEQIAPPYLKRPTIPSDSALASPPNTLTSQRDEPRPHLARDDPRPAHPIHRRMRKQRRFAWKITGVTACSRSCGGGLQTTVVSCIREYTQTPVLERRCAGIEKPAPHPIKCNVQECPPRWGGQWGGCTGSCGRGLQRYMLQCEQEAGGDKTVVVEDSLCPKPRPQETSRACVLPPCEEDEENAIDNELHQRPDVVSSSSKTGNVKEWTVGAWSQCSVSCGTGYRSRSVTCPSGECHPENRPDHAEYCEAGACSSTPGRVSPWLVTEWSQCSEFCGTGTQNRHAHCSSASKDQCQASKPETSRACSSDRSCGGQWFAGPWGVCSDSCEGPAFRKREVLCIIRVRGHARITNDMTCPAGERPPSEQACSGECPPRWYTGEWGDCGCPVGVQRREVRCMEAGGRTSQACQGEAPTAKRACGCAKEEEPERNRPVQDEPVDASCQDKIRNCHLAVQARLCQYPYYVGNCCVSCRKAQELL